MNTYLVCGGAGYIGSHMVRTLVEMGNKVVVVDSLETGYRESVAEQAIFYECSISDIAQLNNIFQEHDIDAVVHFAANSLVGESVKNPMKYYNNNVYGTQCLLDVMLKNNVMKIVFSSSAAVYGETNREPIKEETVTNPTNPYGETKLVIEKMIKWMDVAYGLKSVCLRYFNACGAHPKGDLGEAHDPETHLIPLVLQVANGQRDRIAVFGNDYNTEDGTCVRDYVHVMDLVDAHLLSLDYLATNTISRTYNLGSGKGYSVNEIIQASRNTTGRKIHDCVEGRRSGDPATLIASSAKIREELGWSPKFESINQIIASAWQWHHGHPRGYRK